MSRTIPVGLGERSYDVVIGADLVEGYLKALDAELLGIAGD